ncbi:MAG: ABC transporter ATP-binding protein [Clostridia bacterium]|nr:ABC transporter ATP-binding protein [Clostridia bacterium]
MLEIYNLTKSYGDKKAVEDLTFTVNAGELCAFIGHNGAGKTTTLKCVAGILGFEGGHIRVDGVSPEEDALEVKRRIAYIPDNPDLYDFMTGMQYLNFIGDIFGVPQDVREERIRKYSDALALTDGEIGSMISSYSHGMKQKLALISAFLHDPKLILLDEPFVGLDPKASHVLKEIMKEFCREGGAILFSTHILEVAEKLCDKVVIIKGGRLVAFGSMEEVKGNSSLEDVFLDMEDNND